MMIVIIFHDNSFVVGAPESHLLAAPVARPGMIVDTTTSANARWAAPFWDCRALGLGRLCGCGGHRWECYTPYRHGER